jgi:hypothetical protein
VTPIRVVNVRELTSPGGFLYVGRRVRHPVLGWLGGHPLANPFKVFPTAGAAAKEQCLARYADWLEGQLCTDNGRRCFEVLAKLAGGRDLPLACWCGTWDGLSEPAPLCHAVVLARRCTAWLVEKKEESRT